MRQVPNEVNAADYFRKSIGEYHATQRVDGSWIPAREFNVGWNWFDALKTRFRLSWLVFTGRADALTWNDKREASQ